ncbi:hypothetical protein KAU51_04180 [Candidatus Parcubacteria bacterium]|nr:hypothetical protein [Candidatus Parcubacteria bacterium]
MDIFVFAVITTTAIICSYSMGKSNSKLKSFLVMTNMIERISKENLNELEKIRKEKDKVDEKENTKILLDQIRASERSREAIKIYNEILNEFKKIR